MFEWPSSAAAAVTLGIKQAQLVLARGNPQPAIPAMIGFPSNNTLHQFSASIFLRHDKDQPAALKPAA